MKHFLMTLLVGLLFSGDALGRYNDTGYGGGVPWLLAIPFAIINLIIDLWIPLAIVGGVLLVIHLKEEKKKEKRNR